MAQSNAEILRAGYDVSPRGARHPRQRAGHVVVMVTEKGEREGAQLSALDAHVWQLQDGKATSFQAYSADQYAEDEFWA